MLGDLLAPVTSSPAPSASPPSSGLRLHLGLPGQEWALPGRLTTVVAPPRWLDGLASRLLLDTVRAGRDAFVVCGDNRLDAYGLLAQARAAGLEAELADGVWLARAFTVHQLVALLEETLPHAGRRHALGLALTTGLLDAFLDEDVAPAEARTLLTRSLARLDRWARTVDFPVIATMTQGAGPRAEALLRETRVAGGPRIDVAPPNLDRAPSRARQAHLEVA